MYYIFHFLTDLHLELKKIQKRRTLVKNQLVLLPGTQTFYIQILSLYQQKPSITSSNHSHIMSVGP